jgi:hypothetical protein
MTEFHVRDALKGLSRRANVHSIPSSNFGTISG